MSHPVANDPVLSVSYPEMVENVTMSTVAYLSVPERLKEATAIRAAEHAFKRLDTQGADVEISKKFADVAAGAVIRNAKAFDRLSVELGVSIEALLYTAMRINAVTLESIGEEMSSTGKG